MSQQNPTNTIDLLRRKAVRVYGVPAGVLAAGLRGYVEASNVDA